MGVPRTGIRSAAVASRRHPSGVCGEVADVFHGVVLEVDELPCHVVRPEIGSDAPAGPGRGPAGERPGGGLCVEADRAQLSEIVQRVGEGRLRPNISNVATLDDGVTAFNPSERVKGKTIISVRPVRTRHT